MSNQVEKYTDLYGAKADRTMQIAYTLRFPEPHTHYLQVEMRISHIHTPSILLKMPVWTPGSYLIREFARHIDFVESQQADGSYLRADKISKNTWQLDTQGRNQVTLRYAVYCFEWSVRTNFINTDHAFLNGAATYLYVAGQENTPVDIHVEPYVNWNNISTTLAPKDGNPWIRKARNLDELVDSPIEIGNHPVEQFTAGGIPHDVAIFSPDNTDTGKLIHDLKRVIEEEVAIFVSHPCEKYLFIIHHSGNSFGGLEHLQSSVNHITYQHYEGKKYQHAISLLAHEYFHAWNIKCIRPAELVTYQYEQESYTKLLWFFEGVTSYYDDLFCCRAGVFSRETYLDIVADNLNRVVNTPGIQVQTLAEASFDTWLKYYRQNENSYNSQISYYTKGGIVAMLFDFLILHATNGQRSLDDVMRRLFADSQLPSYPGVTENSILQIFNEISGIDFSPYFHKYIHTTDPLDAEEAFARMGFKLTDTTPADAFHLGLHIQREGNKWIISRLERGFGAYNGGLNVHDCILLIDDMEMSDDWEKILSSKKTGDTLHFSVSRQGAVRELRIPVTITPDTRKHFRIENLPGLTPAQQQLQLEWLKSRYKKIV